MNWRKAWTRTFAVVVLIVWMLLALAGCADPAVSSNQNATLVFTGTTTEIPSTDRNAKTVMTTSATPVPQSATGITTDASPSATTLTSPAASTSSSAYPVIFDLEVSWLQVNDSRGKYLVRSVFIWRTALNPDDFSLVSLNISYLDESNKEFTSQSWTTESIRNAWGGSNRLSADKAKGWTVNYYLDTTSRNLTVRYACKITDKTGQIMELTQVKHPSLNR